MENRELEFRIYNTETKGYIDIESSAIMLSELNDLKPHLIVEQYTRIKDKHGTKIFEGDFIQNEDGRLRLIDDIQCYDLLWAEDHSNFGNWSRKLAVVIGNVNMNPELAKRYYE